MRLELIDGVYCGTCSECGKARVPVEPATGKCFDADANGERVLETGCYGALEVSERERLGAIAAVWGGTHDECTHLKYGEYGFILGNPMEVTPEALRTPQARAAKAAFDAATETGLDVGKACLVAHFTRQAPGKAVDILAAAVQAHEAEALEAAKADAPAKE